MKQTDRVILEGLRKSVLADLPQVEWDMVVKAVVEAGDVRDVRGMARTIVFDAIEKASFASRSEAGRYAANQRWGNRMARASAGSPPDGGKGRIAAEARWGAKGKKPFMDLTDIDPTGSMDKPASEEKKSPSTDGVDEKTAKRIKEGDLSEISRLIEKDFRRSGKTVPYSAKPYLDALNSLEHVGQKYGADSGKSIVAYTLSNLSSWKGPVARAVKAELKARLKAGPPQEFVDEMQASFDAQARE